MPAAKQIPAVERPSAASGAAKAPTGAPRAMVPAVQTSGAVALPADLAAELAGYAKDEAAKERPKLSKISMKSGMMTYQGQPVPQDTMDVVVVSYAFRNTWYSGSYDPDNIVNPACFAVGTSDDNMQAHANVPDENVPEDDPEKPRAAGATRSCDGCSKNAWGTATRDGKPTRGKACKEGRRLLVVPASAVDSVDALKTAEMAVVDIPVTSVGNFGTYINTLSAAVQRPMWAVITRLQLVRDVRTQFKLTFTPTQMINNPAVIRALKARLEDAQRIAMTPHDEADINPHAKKEEPVKGPASKKFAAKR